MAEQSDIETKISELEAKLTKLQNTGENANAEVVRLLTQDVQSHREYLHKLYRTVFIAGGVLVATGLGFIYFMLGKQLDARVYEYRIAEALKAKVEAMSEEELIDAEAEIKKFGEKAKEEARIKIETFGTNAKEDVRVEVDKYVREKISSEVVVAMEAKLKDFTAENFSETILRITFPTGSVVAFDRQGGCPERWEPFKEAESRVIVGVGPNNPFGKTGGEEEHTLTIQEMPTHNHTGTTINTNTPVMTDIPPPNTPVAGRFSGDVPYFRVAQNYQIPSEGGGQSHNNMPPYLVLHYCIKT